MKGLSRITAASSQMKGNWSEGLKRIPAIARTAAIPIQVRDTVLIINILASIQAGDKILYFILT